MDPLWVVTDPPVLWTRAGGAEAAEALSMVTTWTTGTAHSAPAVRPAPFRTVRRPSEGVDRPSVLECGGVDCCSGMTVLPNCEQCVDCPGSPGVVPDPFGSASSR